MAKHEDVNPDPEYLIKSISEQGYSLETALADLIDNSITAKANKIEILINLDESPFSLYIVDNGDGMSEDVLKANMKFPSHSPEVNRIPGDLGRFGLGLKTASFSQTRKFTVISKKKGKKKYAGRCWDVDYLKDEKKWWLLVNSDEEINNIIKKYKTLSSDFINSFNGFEANTIIVWQGLYKFEDYLNEKIWKDAVKKQITESTAEHLSLVFHRFMEKKKHKLQIRINNDLLKPFNPFPTDEKEFRQLEYKQKKFKADNIKIAGFILPARSIDESKTGVSVWTTRNKSLMDMEGIYIYRADRIILYGGWNGLIKKAPRLQLARLMVDIGNKVDHFLHLNVAKSQVVIPHDLKGAFEKYIDELKIEAEREFYNKGIKLFSKNKKVDRAQLFVKKASSRGILLELNREFPLLHDFFNDLPNEQLSKLKMLIRMINTSINKIRQTHEDNSFFEIKDSDSLSQNDIICCIKHLKENGLPVEEIKRYIFPYLGYQIDSLPKEIIELLK